MGESRIGKSRQANDDKISAHERKTYARDRG
jgi:hypothetical protein